MAKILYGVHGYGRGHAVRSYPIIKNLKKTNEVKIMAGGAAYEFLNKEFEVTPIPYLAFQKNKKDKVSKLKTLKHNKHNILNLTIGLGSYDSILDHVYRWDPDIAIIDSEAWVAKLAQSLDIPLISFDSYGRLLQGKPFVSFRDKLQFKFDMLVYKNIIRKPDRILTSCFYNTTPCSTKSIPCIIRDEVKNITPTKGDHILAYFNDPPTEQRLQALENLPNVVYYGPNPPKSTARVTFKPISNLEFVKDLVSCKAIISSCGVQLSGEAVYLGKPMLVVPEDTVEQRINSHYIETMGIGERTKTLTKTSIQNFMKNLHKYETNMASMCNTDGTETAIKILNKWVKELTSK